VLRRRRVTFIAVGTLTALLALSVALAAGRGGSQSSTAVPQNLPGELTGPAPWPRNVAQLRPRLAALNLPALAFEGTVLHIHQHLDLFVHGRRVVVPAGIGIDAEGQFISPLHTHDTSGIVHVESPTVRRFTLGQFFGVWGVRLGPGRLGGYVDHGDQTLRAYVNGRAVDGDPSGLALAPHQEIVLAFGTPRQLPRPIPADSSFPAGY
jgi:hypothetical protein